MTDQEIMTKREKSIRGLAALQERMHSETKAARIEFDRLAQFAEWTNEDIRNLAARLMRQTSELIKENEELVGKLNNFYRDYSFFTADHVPPRGKRVMADMHLERYTGPSIASAFGTGMEVQKSLTGTRAALIKNEKDPKQTEKKFIKSCWTDWRQNSVHYKSKAAFARDMIEKCEHLTSTKKIEDWCRKWEKEHSSS